MSDETKECIACAEKIQINAKLCRYCSTHQNDRRFTNPVVNVGVEAAQRIHLKQNKTTTTLERYCSECMKYVVTSEFYDRCEVCRGEATVGRLPRQDNSEIDAVQSEGAGGDRVLPPGYTHVPLGPTPGIAVVAVIVAFFVPLLGLILGYSARTEVRNPNNPKEGDGLATIAIVVGWIWIALGIIWILVIIGAAAAAPNYEY